MNLGTGDIIIIVAVVIAIIVVGLYFLNRWAYKKIDSQQAIIDKAKVLTTIYVIDKKKDKITNVKMPKAVVTQMPKIYKLMKMRFVQAKIGPQIITLICDKNVFDAIPVKKNVKVDIAGLYIVGMPGLKTKKELKQAKKEKNKEKNKNNNNSNNKKNNNKK